jgi:hypothetical protein
MPKIITEAGITTHLQTLRETPSRIAALIEGKTEADLRLAPAPKEWSTVEILAHLRACADVWGYTIYAMYMLDNPQLAFIHPRDWTKKMGYMKLPFAENFLAFQVERKNLHRILEKLSFEAWGRSARFIGKANTQTIFSQAMRMALHELDHCNQLETMFSGS